MVNSDHNSIDDYEIFQELHEIRVSYHIHLGNYRELKHHLDVLREWSTTWTPENRGAFLDAFLEVQRCLQNFLASATALLDHTKRHVRRHYRHKAFGIECEIKLQPIESSGVHQFVEKLRNCNLHEVAARVWAGQTSTPFGPKSHARLLVADLLEATRWKGAAKQYLEQSIEWIDIEAVVDEHMDLVEEFHVWLHDRECDTQVELLDRIGRTIESVPIRRKGER